MTPFVRKLALLAHVVFSAGWLGAVIAYLALAIAGLAGGDPLVAHAAGIWMRPLGWYVVVPLSVATLLTGLIQSLGTRWGLFRHVWIVAKFGLTVVAAAVLYRHMIDVSRSEAWPQHICRRRSSTLEAACWSCSPRLPSRRSSPGV